MTRQGEPRVRDVRASIVIETLLLAGKPVRVDDVPRLPRFAAWPAGRIQLALADLAAAGRLAIVSGTVVLAGRGEATA